ncbi:MAG: copper resistance system multicopper oxidase [Alphaproteobacteria bacterium]|nr:MAG: copper resistance system multicopper oxidase [Alphaproteobacteria bacterium]
MISRRQFIHATSAAGMVAGMQALAPAWARQLTALGASAVDETHRVFDLAIRQEDLSIAGKTARAKTINGTLPGPLLRFREGETVTIRVHNDLDEDTSLHWHGILLPAEMDGVPGISFPGIRPGETFEYRYTLKQSGTYWYHSHSGLQEQSGVYGPMIIDPAEPDPVRHDREYVVMLSDWTFEDPHHIFAKLKKHSEYFNYQKRTLGDFFRDASEQGLQTALSHRLAWGRMRMDPTDIADVTGATYTYLINGQAPSSNWTALFRPGERIRLRFINAAAMTYFNLRIPGIAMTVVQADGQNVQPVTIDEFQIGVAETYDVIVEPKEDRAYTIFAESMDRSGYARATLAPREGMTADIPPLRDRPLLTMADMGMAHTGHMAPKENEADQETAAIPSHEAHRHGRHHRPEDTLPVSYATTGAVPPDLVGVGVDAVAEMPQERLHEPGTGLEDVDHRVLVYTDLRNTHGTYDPRPPGREIILHLTGNMERYMWSFDGKKFSEVKDPIRFDYGERLRLTMINNTMMNHPIHLHGMWMELDNGAGAHKPRKHTINIKPGARLSVEITADAPGDWAFHCHLLYHMKAGMFRIVSVTRKTAEARP